MDREREARVAVASMISSNMLPNQNIHGQPVRSSSIEGLSSVDLSHSINTNRVDYSTEDVMSGYRHDGRMSVVRRFFCLFVTFDLLFTVLMWLICIMIIGEDIVSALVNQVVHYSIHTSLFDIVMAACARFIVLIMFYALLYVNHWFIIAISTSGTCAFLLAKVFVYHWASASQPAFQVLLILTSFILSWGEAWFLDFRVLPQESHARQFFLVSRTVSDPNIPRENDPLLGARLGSYYGGRMEHSAGNFYSPMESPEVSDDEGDGGHQKVQSQRKLTPQYLPSQIQMRFPGAENLRKLVFGHSSKDIVEVPVLSEEDYKKKGHEVLKEAWHLLNCDSWRLEKRGSGDTSEGGDACDEVFSMVHPGQKGKKIYRLRGRVEIAPKVLLDELFFRLENVPSWNPTILESHRIQTVDDHTDISYIVTAEGGGGLVSSRDFVNLRHWDVIDGSYISAGVSVIHPEKPPQKKYVRGENGPGCWAMSPIVGNPGSCSFQWLLDTNLKGWLTPIVVDGALTGAMFDYIRHLRKYAQKLNSSKGSSSFIMPISSQEEEQIAVNS